MEDAAGRRRRLPRWLVVLGIVGGVILLAVGVALFLTASPEGEDYPEGLTWEQHEWDSGLTTRRYSIGVPDDLPPGRHPAVVSLHPMGGNRAGWAGETDQDKFAISEDYVFVVPQGMWGMWNVNKCCGPANWFNVDDVSFIDEVLERVGEHPRVDPERVYLSGLSNGALMVAHHLCNGTVMPAAAAAVAATPWTMEGCEDTEVPSLFSMGTADEVFPFDGGWSAMGAAASMRPARPWSEFVDEAVQAWSCESEPERRSFSVWSQPTKPTTKWDRDTYQGCRADLVLTIAEGVPHTWLWGGDWSHTKETLGFFGIHHEDLSPEPATDP